MIMYAIMELAGTIKEARDASKETGDILGDKIMKLTGNSGYGKTAQGNREYQSIDLQNSTPSAIKRTKVPPSKISNPAIASYITGWVRAVMAEYLIFCQQRNLLVCAMTTDGFTLIDCALPADAMGGVGMLGYQIRDHYKGR